MLDRIIYEAEVVYNGLGTPRADAAAVVQRAAGAATLVAIERRDRLGILADGEVVDAGFAVSPAPVNAHTHLDLSTMPFTPGDYTSFIGAAIAHGRSGARGLAAAEAGVAELLASGVRVVGDIVGREAVMPYLLAHPQLRGVAYWEVIGPDPADAERLLAETAERLRGWRSLERPGGVRVGLSPHTPHTVSGPLLQRLARLALDEGYPLQIHAAESEVELAYHRDGSGPLAEMLRPVAPEWRPSGLGPVAYLERLGVLEARPTLVHAVHEVRALQRAGCAVVHCPRSNLALSCGRLPWERYARHGVTVAFGTDSRGSSPSLSVLDEVAAARGLHGERASALALVRAAVKGGYRALGLTPPTVQRGSPAAALSRWQGGAALPLG
jgi:cytosine/adenosine deaminase-related metal-dependent hydrolase